MKARIAIWSESSTDPVTKRERHQVHLSVNGFRLSTDVDSGLLAIAFVARLANELGLAT